MHLNILYDWIPSVWAIPISDHLYASQSYMKIFIYCLLLRASILIPISFFNHQFLKLKWATDIFDNDLPICLSNIKSYIGTLSRKLVCQFIFNQLASSNSSSFSSTVFFFRVSIGFTSSHVCRSSYQQLASSWLRHNSFLRFSNAGPKRNTVQVCLNM